MWYVLGHFVPGVGLRRQGTHRVSHWCIVSGPHYKRDSNDKRKEVAARMAETMASVVGYECESLVNVHASDLRDYKLSGFPWLVASAPWPVGGEE